MTSRSLRRVEKKAGSSTLGLTKERDLRSLAEKNGRGARNGDAASRPVARAFPPFFIESATAGDHGAIYELLKSSAKAPSILEFQTQLDEPLYEPTDRVLAKRGDHLAAHVLLTKHEMLFLGQELPIAGLHQLVTCAEYRNQGLGAQVLQLAEHQMREEGAAIAVLETTRPQYFARRGWFVWPRERRIVAGSREILSWIRAQPPAERPILDYYKPAKAPQNIRLLRAVELPALQRLYSASFAESCGPLLRNEARWRWLVGRRPEDRIYVAIEGPDRMELDESFDGVVGYAIVRNDCLMELVADPACPEARRVLLERVCGDAIENDDERIQLHLAANDPACQIVLAAGGRTEPASADGSAVAMAKVLDEQTLLERLGGSFAKRSKQAGFGSSCELGCILDGEKKRFVVRNGKARIEHGSIGRSYLTCTSAMFHQLLLGHWEIDAAIESGKLEASTRVAAENASVLFPTLAVWMPRFDRQEAI